MPANVILTVIEGKLLGKQYVFDSRAACLIGRSNECNIMLPDDEDHRTISRYHCLLDINPPNIRVRDFGSRNGTYVNDVKIGQREPHQTAEEGRKLTFPEYDLQSEDKIKLSNTTFVVGIELDPNEVIIPNFFPATVRFNQDPTQPPNFIELVNRWIGLAESGNQSLEAIKGYKLIQLIGKGGFGEVYLAQHHQSGTYVALKVMLPGAAVNQSAVNRFMREIENTKALQHPNVIQLLDSGFFEGIFFFTMEYCNGGTVSNLMEQQGGRLPVNIAVPIILQVLDGLEYTHNIELPDVKLADGSFGKGKGLVHRDLKPGNLLLSNIDGKFIVKIADYGLAKAFDLAGLSGQTLSGTQAGTPVFIPRQQLLDFKYTQPDVDIWATAACLYNMLTGYYPRDFKGGDQFLAVLQNDPVPIRERDSSIPQRLASVIDLALVEKPEIYFKSAAEFKKTLLSVV